jgi:hypothetical protein
MGVIVCIHIGPGAVVHGEVTGSSGRGGRRVKSRELKHFVSLRWLNSENVISSILMLLFRSCHGANDDQGVDSKRIAVYVCQRTRFQVESQRQHFVHDARDFSRDFFFPEIDFASFYVQFITHLTVFWSFL